MKKIIGMMICLVIMATLFGCATQSTDNKIDLVFSKNTFDDTYNEYSDFDKMSENITSYYNEIIKAYNKSDKKNLSTFKPSDISKQEQYIDSFKMGMSMDKSEYAGLALISKIANTRKVIAGMELAALGGDEIESEFANLKESIIEAYNTYSSALDFSEMPK